MNLPSKFKIANNEILVKVADHSIDNDYGTWCDATNTINLYKQIKVEEETVILTEEQILNTFYHELFHCFQFYAGLETDERTAQVFANFMREFESTKI